MPHALPGPGPGRCVWVACRGARCGVAADMPVCRRSTPQSRSQEPVANARLPPVPLMPRGVPWSSAVEPPSITCINRPWAPPLVPWPSCLSAPADPPPPQTPTTGCPSAHLVRRHAVLWCRPPNPSPPTIPSPLPSPQEQRTVEYGTCAPPRCLPWVPAPSPAPAAPTLPARPPPPRPLAAGCRPPWRTPPPGRRRWRQPAR